MALPLSRTPIELPVMLNYAPFYALLHLDINRASISAEIVLQAAFGELTAVVIKTHSELALRWITYKGAAFSKPKANSSPKDAWNWYTTKGRSLVSILVDDATLRTRLLEIEEGDYVRLYVVAPPATPPLTFTTVEANRHSYLAFLRPQVLDTDHNIRVPTTAWNPPPNVAAKDRKIHREAQLGPAPIYDGRQPLANNLGPSACLYHKAFAMLSRALDDDTTLSEIDVPQDMMSALFKLRFELAQPTVVDEKSYMTVLKKYLPPLFPGTTFRRHYQIPRCSNPNAIMDFALTVMTPYGIEVVVVAGEAKFQEGDGGAASRQALYGYKRMYLLKQYQSIFNATSCPCITLGATGPLLSISGVFFAGHIYSTPMGKGIVSLEFVPGFGDVQDTKLARQIQAIRNAVDILSKSYKETHTGAYCGADYVLPTPYFPKEPNGDWTPARTFQDFTLKFTDTCFTTEGRAIFKGVITLSTDPPSHVDVYVKFVRKDYNKGAVVHEHLAKKFYAPTLRWYGAVFGGPFMVIMDEVKGSTLEELLHHPEGRPVGENQLTSLDAAIREMHAHGYVHGDLRPPNVVLLPWGTANIIDFDWAGREGEARYPYDIVLNKKVRWSRDPEHMPGSLITKFDDTSMRKNILLQLQTDRNQVKSAAAWGVAPLMILPDPAPPASTSTSSTTLSVAPPSAVPAPRPRIPLSYESCTIPPAGLHTFAIPAIPSHRGQNDASDLLQHPSQAPRQSLKRPMQYSGVADGQYKRRAGDDQSRSTA